MESENQRIEQAAAAGEDTIARFVHDPSAKVVKALLANNVIREEDVLAIANRRNIPGDVLDMIGRDRRWSESYLIRLALAHNPKTPLSVSLSIVRYLRIFDIAELTRSHFLPLAFRHKVESIITERIPTMPLGYKKTLAKMAMGNVLFKLLQDADAEVVGACLDNPHLQENHLFKIVNRRDSVAQTIQMIARHRNWSKRLLVRYALVRNDHTPLSLSELFLKAMKLQEVRELDMDPRLPKSVKPLVHRELISRGQEPGKEYEEPVFEVDENDDSEIDDFEEVQQEQKETSDPE